MATNPLFKPQIAWDKSKLPAGIPHRVSNPEAMSKYGVKTPTTKMMSTVNSGIFRAVAAYIENKNCVTSGTYFGRCAVGIANESYVSEYEHSSGVRAIASYNKKTCILEGANVSLSSRYEVIDLNKTSPEMGTVFFLAMLPALLEDEEAKNAFDIFEEKYLHDNFDSDAKNAIALLSDNIYRRIEGTTCDESERFVVKIPSTGDVRVISNVKVRSGFYAPESIVCGDFRIFSTDKATSSIHPLSTTIRDLKKRFGKFNEGRVWTEEEQEMIKHSTSRISDDDIASPEVVEMAEYIVGSMDDKKPIVNFIWRGETGFGKSYGCEELAKVLGMPLVRITCNPTMETLDFLNKFVPDTTRFDASAFPSFEDIAYDPETAYEMLTGEHKEGVTSQECLEIYTEVVASKKSTTPKFKLVESDYVKALANGYILEIQEPSVIINSGVLTGLNEYNRPGSVITLPDGSIKIRHKNAIVIMTDNVTYEGCRPMNQSVVRRSFLAIDSYKMGKDEIITRCKEMSGFDDDEVLERMYEIWDSIKDFCKERSITDGSTSIEELGNWCQAVRIRGVRDLRNTCIRTVVSKATAMVDEQEAIISSCIDTKLA